MKRLSLVLVLITGIAFSSCANANNGENKKTKDKDKKVINLTKEEFLTKVMDFESNTEEWIYAGDKPCIIDFYADWCGPCKKVAPILEELANEYDGEIYIYKIDTDKERELAQAFGIRSIPSILFVPMDGKPQMSMGALPKATLKSNIDSFLLNKESK